LTPRAQLSADVDPALLRARHGEALGREHVAQLARADSEGHSSEGAMGRGVAVAAGDGHAGLGVSASGRCWELAGMMWYTMAKVLDGKRTGSSSSRSIAKA
jgi:hypothetical protein